MKKLNKNSKQLLLAFRECQYTDILGFGNILGVNDDQEFDDYLTAIIMNYENESKHKQKALLKLAKDIVKANKELVPRPHENIEQINEVT